MVRPPATGPSRATPTTLVPDALMVPPTPTEPEIEPRACRPKLRSPEMVVEPLRVIEPLSPVSTETPAESLPLTMIDPLLWVIEPFMVPGPTTRMPNSLDWFAQGPSLMPSPLLSE